MRDVGCGRTIGDGCWTANAPDASVYLMVIVTCPRVCRKSFADGRHGSLDARLSNRTGLLVMGAGVVRIALECRRARIWKGELEGDRRFGGLVVRLIVQVEG